MASTNNNAADGAQKLATLLGPLLNEHKKELKDHNTVISQEILIAIGGIAARMEVLEKALAEKKKNTVRGEKKAAGGADVAPSPPADGSATTETAVQQPAGTQKNFPVNKLVYFREQFKTNPDYRNKYVSEDIRKLMDADTTISGKTNPAQKLIAEATFCWNYFKTNKQDIADAIEKEFQAAKKMHEDANKPQQQTAEAHTPGADTQ